MTHDLLKNALVHLGAEIKKIVVTELNENTFFAMIHMDLDGQPTTLDSRPSDAIALALRTDAPIFVTEQVIKNSRSLALDRKELDPKDVREWLENLHPEDLGKYEM